MDEHEDRLTVPTPFLSSESAGWEGLLVRAFHEPLELEGWTEPTVQDITLVQITSGAMYMEQRLKNGACTSFHVRQGDLFLDPGGGTSAQLYWRSLAPEPLQTLRVQLSADLFSRTAEEIANCDPRRLQLSGRAAFQDPLLRQIGLALSQELARPVPAGKLYAQTAAQMLAVHLLRHYTTIDENIELPTRGLTPRQMKRVTDFVQAHLDQDLSLEALARQAGFSPYHFARLFKQTTGESPHQFVLRQRIKQAQRLLTETDAPLAHIALESGFASQSHLAQVFKRQLGLTLRAYRQTRSRSASF